MGDRITLIGDIYPGTLELTVRGIFDSPRKSEMLYFNWAYVREGLSEDRKGEVGTFDILCDNAGVVPRVSKTIDDGFHNAPVQTRTETEQAFLLSFVSMLGNVKMFLISICAAVMFTILLVSGNTMAMSVLPPIRKLDPTVASACILVALGIGLLSSFIPAWNASRTNIVEALRSTD